MRPWPSTSDYRGAFGTAIVVGSLLCVINHSYQLGNARGITLNYLVPLMVSLYSKWTVRRA